MKIRIGLLLTLAALIPPAAAEDLLQVYQGAQAHMEQGRVRMLYGRPITWSLSDSTVATIAITGFVQAIAAGTTTVIATCEGRTGTAVVTVAP